MRQSECDALLEDSPELEVNDSYMLIEECEVYLLHQALVSILRSPDLEEES